MLNPFDHIHQAKVIRAYKKVFLGSDEGQAVLRDLASKGMLDSTVFSPDNPHQTSHNAGYRDCVIDIFATCNVDLRQFLTDDTTMEDIN